MPEVVDGESIQRAGIRSANLQHYPGLKEQIYLHNFHPKSQFLNNVGVDATKIIVTIRPLGSGHYCDTNAKPILDIVLERLNENKERLFVIALPRDEQERKNYCKQLSNFGLSYLVPEQALPGPDLVYHSDLVITGSGTMAREAAVLGVPAYTVFSGPKGAVDRYLASIKRKKG